MALKRTAGRPIWNGHLTFGLVSIPVGLYPAVEHSEEVHFRLLHRKDKAPIVYKKFCSKEDVEVPNSEVVKGYEVGKGHYATVEKDELQKVQKEAAGGEEHVVEVLSFVDFSSISPLFVENPYYLVPQEGGMRPYAVLRDALADSKMAGVARFTPRTRPTLGIVAPTEDALTLVAMRSHEEIRDPDALGIPKEAKRAGEIRMAKLLIDQMSGSWDPTEHPDDYKKALEKLLATKRKGAPRRVRAAEDEEEGGEVVDLMEALRKSLSAGGGKRAGSSSHPSSKGRSRKTA